MTEEQLNTLTQDIKNISSHFEPKPFSDNVKLLKEDFDINQIDTPQNYFKSIAVITEVLREARLLFLYSVLNKVCEEDGKLYNFDTPYQANMSYSAVVKKEGDFYLLDEDGDYRGIFTSESFTQFIDEQYWELYG